MLPVVTNSTQDHQTIILAFKNSKAPLLLREPLRYVRNSKTVQIIIENRKPQAKSETRRTRLRPLRRKFSEEEPEKHQTASNGKSEYPILFFAENRKLRAKYTRNRPLQVTKTEKPKYFDTQTENGQNRKSQCPHLLPSSESFKAETLHFITNSHEKKRY